MDKPNRKVLIGVMLHSLSLPVLFLLTGILFETLVWANLKVSYSHWQELVHLAGQLGNILIILSFVLFVYRSLVSICDKYRQYLIQKHRYTLAKVIAILRKGSRFLFLLFAVNVIVTVFGFEHRYVGVINDVIYVVMIAAVAWILLNVISLIEDILYRKYIQSLTPGAKRSGLSYTKFHIIKNILAILIIVIAVAASLMVFDKVRNIGISLLASAGFLTAVFALAAQKTLSSVFVGFQLVLSRPVEIGDWVTIDKESGTIEEITLSYLIVVQTDGRRLILPVSYFMDKPFHSWSRSLESISGTIRLYVAHKAKLEPLRKALMAIVKENSLWDGKVANLVAMEFLENNTEIEITVSAATPTDLKKLRTDVRESMLRFMCESYPESLPVAVFSSLSS
jgi:small-conductance mechanosensitive channel